VRLDEFIREEVIINRFHFVRFTSFIVNASASEMVMILKLVLKLLLMIHLSYANSIILESKVKCLKALRELNSQT